MIKVQVQAVNFDRQVALLKEFPKIADRAFRPAMKASVSGFGGLVEPNIPTLTGAARAAYGTWVTGRGMNLTGRVGWKPANYPWYINVVEYGASAHEMDTYVPRLGVRIKTHPGFGERAFLRTGYEAFRPVSESLFAAAGDVAVNALQVN